MSALGDALRTNAEWADRVETTVVDLTAIVGEQQATIDDLRGQVARRSFWSDDFTGEWWKRRKGVAAAPANTSNPTGVLRAVVPPAKTDGYGFHASSFTPGEHVRYRYRFRFPSDYPLINAARRGGGKMPGVAAKWNDPGGSVWVGNGGRRFFGSTVTQIDHTTLDGLDHVDECSCRMMWGKYGTFGPYVYAPDRGHLGSQQSASGFYGWHQPIPERGDPAGGVERRRRRGGDEHAGRGRRVPRGRAQREGAGGAEHAVAVGGDAGAALDAGVPRVGLRRDDGGRAGQAGDRRVRARVRRDVVSGPERLRPAATLVAEAVAAYRLTKLATDDTVTQPARDRVIEAAYVAAGRREAAVYEFLARRGQIEMAEGDWQQVVEEDDLPPKLAVLVTCRWCAGYWIALAVVFLCRGRSWWPAVRDASVLSAAAALLARLEDG